MKQTLSFVTQGFDLVVRFFQGIIVKIIVTVCHLIPSRHRASVFHSWVRVAFLIAVNVDGGDVIHHDAIINHRG